MAGVAAVAGLSLLEWPLDRGLSDAERARAIANGRSIFATQCVVCHSEHPDRPSPAELRRDYSRGQLSRALDDPPPGMPAFFGSETDRRDLLLYLTQE